MVRANRGIWSGGVGSIRLQAQDGDQAPSFPAGDTFVIYNSVLGNVSVPMLNNAGHVAFTAQLTGGGINDSNNEGIWTDVSGHLAPANLESVQVPGMPSGVFLMAGFALSPLTTLTR